MGGEALFLVPIGSAALVASGSALDVHSAVGWVALVSGAAGAIYTTRNRADLAAKNEIVGTLNGEVAVFKQKIERLEVDLRDEQARRAAAEARTDIRKIEELIVENQRQTTGILGTLAVAIDRLSGAIEEVRST